MKARTTICYVITAICFIACQAYATYAQTNPTPIPRASAPRGSDGGTGSIAGRVVLPSGHPVSERLSITLSTISDPGMLVYTDTNGAFAFSSLRQGTYNVEVRGDNKLYEAVSEQVVLHRGQRAKLVIRLREKGGSEKKSGGVVSVAELDTNIPSAAKDEYEKGTRLSNEGKIREAITSFERAIAIYPRYLMAHNDLGVQYLNLKQWAEAVERFEAAIEIDSKAFNPRLNMGIALVEQKRYTEALDHLNLAISYDSSSPAARLCLGIASLQMDELDEAKSELSLALSIGGAEYAIAHFYLANVHMKNGERDRAVGELRAYLEKAPRGDKVAQARQLLDELKK